MIHFNWQEFKSYITAKNLNLSFAESDDNYTLVAVDGSLIIMCQLAKNEENTSTQDFVTNFKDSANVPNVSDIRQTTPKNEHCTQPFGCVKGIVDSATHGCSITLSNHSEDGKTFTYSSAITPSIGNYVFQDDFIRRSYVVDVDTQNQRVTFYDSKLYDGAGWYSQGEYMDSKVEDWFPLTYLWGVICTAVNPAMNDFIELAIVDLADMFKDDASCMQIFGCDAATAAAVVLPALGFEYSLEYGGHWTKYYDESWVLSCNGKQVCTPDGAPGEILANLYLRISYFTTSSEAIQTHVFIDYFPTSKENK